jgi:hypothetical protein
MQSLYPTEIIWINQELNRRCLELNDVISKSENRMEQALSSMRVESLISIITKLETALQNNDKRIKIK